jgi:predicted transcriptional regulator YheO
MLLIRKLSSKEEIEAFVEYTCAKILAKKNQIKAVLESDENVLAVKELYRQDKGVKFNNKDGVVEVVASPATMKEVLKTISD